MQNNLADLSDGQLVALYREGDERAFGVIFDKHVAFAVNIARKWFHSEDDVDELVHDSFVSFARNIHSFDDSRSIRPWLGKIVWNEMRTRYRKMKSDVNSQTLELTNAVHASPDIYDLPNSGDAELRKAIEQLSEPYQRLLELRYIDGLPLKDIGVALGITYVDVRVSHYRAKKQLRKQLSHVD